MTFSINCYKKDQVEYIIAKYIFKSDEFSTIDDKEDFFTHLGSGSPDKVPDESTADEDAAFENKDASAVTLYKVHLY